MPPTRSGPSTVRAGRWTWCSTDVVLPDVGTDELAHRMHGLSPDLPILYMSAYAWDDVLQRGLIRKEAPFLQKPFTAEELMRGVGKVLR